MHQTVFERLRPSDKVIDQSLDGTKHAVFWLEDAPVASFPPLMRNHSVDLAVVGGGYTGLWAAIEAKTRHPEWEVALLEAGTLGWAASGRNGGFCEYSLTHGYANGAQRWPQQIEELERLGMQNLDEIEAFVRENGIDCDFERTGSIELAVEDYQAEELAETALVEVDENTVFLDERAVREQVNSPSYLAGMWDRRGTAMIHPAKLVAGLARHATALGIGIYEHSRATGLRPGGEQVHVEVTTQNTGAAHSGEAPDLVLTACKVALGTNAFPSLLKRNALMTVPVYDYVLMTEPLSQDQLESIGWQNRQGLADMANQFHYYRLTQDNRILFGGYDAIYHYGMRIDPSHEDRPETYRKLASHFFTTFPQLAGLRFSHRWSGVIDTSTQFCAFFGTAYGAKVAYSAGFTGLGVGATHFAAKVMLDQLDGLDTERTRLDMVAKRPLPFPPEPFASIGIQLTRASLDRADHNRGHRNLFLKTMDSVGLGFDS